MIKHLLLSAAAALLLGSGARASAPSQAPPVALPDFNMPQVKQDTQTLRAGGSGDSSLDPFIGYYDEYFAQGKEESENFIYWRPMVPLENGMYYTTIASLHGNRFVIHTTENGQQMYHVVAASEANRLYFDQFGICETTLEKRVAGGSALDVLSTAPSAYYRDGRGLNIYDTGFYFDLSTGKLYIDDQSSLFIVGDFTTSKKLTFENRNDFEFFTYKVKDNGINCWVGADKLRFSIQSFNKVYYNIWEPIPAQTLDLSDGIGTLLTNDHSGPIYVQNTLYGCQEVSVPGWEGGNVFINYYMVVPMTAPKLYRYNINGNAIGAVEPTYQGGYNFEFTDTPGYSNTQTYYYSLVPPAYNRLCTLANIRSKGYMAENVLQDYGSTVKLSSQEYMAEFAFGGRDFGFPQLFYASEPVTTNVKVSLYAPKIISWSVSAADAANLRNVYSINTRTLNPFGSVLCPPLQEGHDYLHLNSADWHDGSNHRFDLWRHDGFYAAPTGDGIVTYDQYGYWEGSFEILNSVDEAGNWISPAKWNIPADDPPHATLVCLDEANKKLMVHSPEHFDGYFVNPVEDHNLNTDWTSLDDLPRLKSQALLRNDNGVIYGEITVNTDTKGIRLTNVLNDYVSQFVSPDYDGKREVTDNTTLEVPTWYGYSNNPKADYIKVNVSQPTTLVITVKDSDISPSCKMVHVTASPAGIENVTADAESALSLPVRYYNLQGQPIAAPIPGTPCLRVSGTTATKILCK